MAPRLAKLIGPVIEQVAQGLSDGHGTAAKPLIVPTLLTQTNRSAGRAGVRISAKHDASPIRLDAPSGCRECGLVLADRTRQYCDKCLPDYRKVQSGSFSATGRAKLQEMRASGTDPSQMGAAAEGRRLIMKQRRREEAEWEAEHTDMEIDEAAFANEVLPRLQGLSLSVITAHTGLSQQYCSLIRRGLKVPHPRHWPMFAALIKPDD